MSLAGIRNWMRRKIGGIWRSAVFILWYYFIEVTSVALRYSAGVTISSRRVIGIYSREGEESYRFLYEVLRFQDWLVREVRTFTITNNGSVQFREDVSRCDSAILYHSKNRGRINITNVTDSIYDQELHHLFQRLGKENVLVVADDLDSATPEDKQGILITQTLITENARDLILFKKDKNTSREETDKRIMEILSAIDSNTPPITICNDVSSVGWMAGLLRGMVLFCIGCGNVVMRFIFRFFALVGQTRIKHYDQSSEKQA
ncbi:uncharacterized protein ACMZJ9_010681 [Mantella aurantiaca]